MRSLHLAVYDTERERERERLAFLALLEHTITEKEVRAIEICTTYVPTYRDPRPASCMSYYWLLQDYLEAVIAGRTVRATIVTRLSSDDLRDKLRGLVFGVLKHVIAPDVRLWGATRDERLDLYGRLCVWAASRAEVARGELAALKLLPWFTEIR